MEQNHIGCRPSVPLRSPQSVSQSDGVFACSNVVSYREPNNLDILGWWRGLGREPPHHVRGQQREQIEK
jgi:hypothetical protein